VRQIAQAHGGAVHCEPREGGGSCFRLVLPAA
jgi:signal transduction histidine kinase